MKKSKHTLHDLSVAALQARGAVEVKRGKYTVLTRTKSLRGEAVEGKSFWFVGKSGAVRSGPNARDSRPINDEWKDQLLVEGEAALNPPKPASVRDDFTAPVGEL